MHVGAILSQADSGSDPEAIRRFATEIESAGYHHLMAYDHVVGVSASMFPKPIGNFGGVPYTDEHTFHEILVLYSHLAAVTSTLEFVTSVLVAPQRPVALIAKQVATLNLLSGSRIHLAVGVGWNDVEYQALGSDFAVRTQVLDEQIDLLRRLWTEPLVTVEGEFHQLRNVGLNPLPGRAYPIWMGTGGSDAALRRVIAKADGWMPLIIPGIDPIGFADATRRLRQLSADGGRDPASLPIWGRVYLFDGWQRGVEEALELGYTHFSIGAPRGNAIDRQLDLILSAKAAIESLVPATAG